MVEVEAHKLRTHNRIIKDGRELIVAGIQRAQDDILLFSLRDQVQGTEGLHAISRTETFETVPARHMLWIDGEAATVTTLTGDEAHELAGKYINKARKKGVAMIIEITEMLTDDSTDGEEIVYAAQIDEEGGELIARFED